MPDLFTESGAGLSDCCRYRFWLTRTWDRSKEAIVFIMLNPSTADAFVDDPTIKKCIGFARSWGYGGLVVLNLFAFRATDPKGLPAAYPVPWMDDAHQNDRVILELIDGRRVIAAWGVNGTLHDRDLAVMKLLTDAWRSVECLRVTKDGHPNHPLYLPGSLLPVPFKVREVTA